MDYLKLNAIKTQIDKQLDSANLEVRIAMGSELYTAFCDQFLLNPPKKVGNLRDSRYLLVENPKLKDDEFKIERL